LDFFPYRYPDSVTKLVSLAGNAYASAKDFELLEKIWDVSKWSQKMREPMEKTYGKVRYNHQSFLNWVLEKLIVVNI
jgi:valacyclovir hydrolase